jgi:hypothetical protein
MQMAKPEAALAKRVKDNLSGCHITRLESRVGLGIPDMLIAFKAPSKFAMLELKVVSAGRMVRLSPHQVSFHARHAELGCPTFILVDWKAKGELRLYANSQAISLAVSGWVEEPCWASDSKAVSWDMLRHEMVRLR